MIIYLYNDAIMILNVTIQCNIFIYISIFLFENSNLFIRLKRTINIFNY